VATGPKCATRDQQQNTSRLWRLDGEVRGGEIREFVTARLPCQICYPSGYLQISSVITEICRKHQPGQVECAVEIDEEARPWRCDLRRQKIGGGAGVKRGRRVAVVVKRSQHDDIHAARWQVANSIVCKDNAADAKYAGVERENVRRGKKRNKAAQSIWTMEVQSSPLIFFARSSRAGASALRVPGWRNALRSMEARVLAREIVAVRSVSGETPDI